MYGRCFLAFTVYVLTCSLLRKYTVVGPLSIQYVGVVHRTDELMRSAMFLHQRAQRGGFHLQALRATCLRFEQRVFARIMATKTQTRQKEADGSERRRQSVRQMEIPWNGQNRVTSAAV